MKKKLDILENHKVRQSNHLVESPYAQEFSAHEIKIFEIAAAGVKVEDMFRVMQFSNKKYTLTSQQLVALLKTSPSTISHAIEKTAIRIMKKTIHLRKILDNGTIEFEMINIIPFARYKNGILEFDLNYAIIPYLIEINKNFTEYHLQHLLSLRSSYAIKLYKLIYQYKNIGTRIFNIKELKEQFGIANKYQQYKDFRKYIIEPSAIQISELTDLEVNYIEIKVGRKIEKIEFNFKIKEKDSSSNQKKKFNVEKINDNDNYTEEESVEPISENSLILSDVTTLLGNMLEEISAQTKQLLVKLYKEHGKSYIEASINYTKKYAKTNIDKYLTDTLLHGWGETLVQLEMKKSIEVDKERRAKVAYYKHENERKKLEKEQDELNKSLIKDEWDKLLEEDKLRYREYAHYLIDKYAEQLKVINDIKSVLELSIYAISNNKHYDKIVEGYLQICLKINLHLTAYEKY